MRNLSVFRNHSQDLLPGSGVYGEDENKFVFCNVIVGHKAKARFKITNPNKVCFLFCIYSKRYPQDCKSVHDL